ncbi:MAG TPA: DUF4783 domain-containing protein [Saprospiraceae bacterium]|nr:DUF4783 domain-containing protein [Saprospiraceae bacterium]
MKPLTRISTCLLFVLPFMAIGQSSGIDVAINKGSASELGTYLSPKVDVSILDEDVSLTSGEATRYLESFFSKNTVKSYKRAHLTPATNGRSSYSLGDLITATGTYRVYLYFDTNQKISEIRIEK